MRNDKYRSYLAILGVAACLFALYLGSGGVFTSPPPAENYAAVTPGLPYEETLFPSLEEGAQRADYAIVQTIARLELPAGQSRLLEKTLRAFTWPEESGKEAEFYTHKTLRIYTGPSVARFVAALNESLLAWGWKAALFRDLGVETAPGEESWHLLVEGAPTHVLLLRPGRLAPEDAPGQKPLPEDWAEGTDLPRRPRARKPGETPQLCIVMDDIGANMDAVNRLLALDFPVTFSVWPYSAHAREAANAAHARGREVMLHQPMEPLGYPKVKPGPGVLLHDMPPAERRAILQESLKRVPHIAGVNNHMGSRLTQEGPIMREVAQTLAGRGLFVLDSLTHPRSRLQQEAASQGLPSYRRDVFLDDVATRAHVLNQLRQAEKVALLSGRAIAIGHPLPETLSALKEWEKVRDKSIKIVPLKTLTPEPSGH